MTEAEGWEIEVVGLGNPTPTFLQAVTESAQTDQLGRIRRWHQKS